MSRLWFATVAGTRVPRRVTDDNEKRSSDL